MTSYEVGSIIYLALIKELRQQKYLRELAVGIDQCLLATSSSRRMPARHVIVIHCVPTLGLMG